MAGRPPLPIGTHGRITSREIAPKLWQASCRFRDLDGETRKVKRTGRSRSAAENALKKALRDRGRTAGPDLDGGSRLRDAGELWLQLRADEVERGELAHRTLETYRSAWRLHVEPALGGLRLREVTTARCEGWLSALRRKVGPSMCRTSRAVLSGVLGYAARLDTIVGNPVRDISPVRGGRTRQPRAMTAAERCAWLEWLDTHVAHDPKSPRRPELHPHPPEVIASRSLGDITRCMLATGCRIGEVMALSWDDVDLEAGTVAIRHRIIRVKGQGLVRMPGAKSAAGERTVRVPSWAVSMLMRRRTDPRSGYPVFPDNLGGWRDPNLVERWIRWSRAEAGFDWLTSHVWRQTVITVLDAAGLPTREISDQVGHSRIVQTQEYMARRVASERAAEALEGMLDGTE